MNLYRNKFFSFQNNPKSIIGIKLSLSGTSILSIIKTSNMHQYAMTVIGICSQVFNTICIKIQWNPPKLTTSGTGNNWSTSRGSLHYKTNRKRLVWDWQNMVTLRGACHFEGFQCISMAGSPDHKN